MNYTHREGRKEGRLPLNKDHFTFMYCYKVVPFKGQIVTNGRIEVVSNGVIISSILAY